MEDSDGSAGAIAANLKLFSRNIFGVRKFVRADVYEMILGKLRGERTG